MKTRTEINCLKGHGGTVTALCTSLDGLLVSGSSDGAIRVWNLETRAQRTFSSGSTHFSGSIAALCTLPDGRIAAAVSYPPFHEDPSIGAFNQIELWDVNEGVETTIFGGGEVTALCVLPDGRLVTSSSDVVGVWRMEGKGGHISLRLAAHARNKKIPLCALPDGRLASTTKDNAISLWDIEAGIETARLEGHSEPITALCMLPDGRLASGSQDNTIRMWDTTSAIQTELIDGLSNYVNNLCSLPNGELLSGSEDGTIRVWDISTSVKTTHRVKRSGPITVLSALTKQRVALVSDDNVIRLCGAETGAEFTRLKGHLAEVKALCLLPDGTLASGGWRSIRLWNVEVGIEIACLGEDSATALCALPHGLLASGDFSKIHIWDMRQHSEAFCLIRSDPKEDPYSLGPSCWISALCALPDGRLASEGRDHTIWLWDLDTKEVSGRLNGHFDNINVLFMLPDGRLASSSRDRTIRLWDLEAKRESVCLKGHRDSVDALCMLPDGRLASASHDRTIRLWAIDTAAEAACLEVDGPVNCLIALPNGCLVAGDKFGYLHWLNVVD